MASLNWMHEIKDVPDHGLAAERSATANERAGIADALEMPALDRLTVRYEICALAGGCYRVSGEIEADVVQNCVVTLEPLAARVVERFALELRPPDQLPQVVPSTFDPLASDDDPEPIEDGRIPIGRIVLEHLIAAIDPYPRKPGATLSRTEAPSAVQPEPPEGPFAALAKLKKTE